MQLRLVCSKYFRSKVNTVSRLDFTLNRGLPVGFILLWYSVLFTVESLSLLYFLLYHDLYVLGDDALIS